MAPAGSAFTVRATRDGRARTIRGTGTVRHRSFTHVTLASAVQAGETVTAVLRQAVRQSAARPHGHRGGELLRHAGDERAAEDPEGGDRLGARRGGDGDTYGSGDTVRVQVTFDVPVRVHTRGGTPRLKLDLVPGTYRDRYDEKWAAYESGGTNTDTLTFAWRVTPIVSNAGIAVPANALDLNGGQDDRLPLLRVAARGRRTLRMRGSTTTRPTRSTRGSTTPEPTVPQRTIWSATLTVKPE